jgi:uncharacterized DUF497 family protein
VDVRTVLSSVVGFEWDEHNVLKNWDHHSVSHLECEEVFFNDPPVIRADTEHSGAEPRYYALGETDAGRLLFVVFVVRKNLIRPISYRDMTRRERRIYGQRR